MITRSQVAEPVVVKWRRQEKAKSSEREDRRLERVRPASHSRGQCTDHASPLGDFAGGITSSSCRSG